MKYYTIEFRRTSYREESVEATSTENAIQQAWKQLEEEVGSELLECYETVSLTHAPKYKVTA